MSRSAAVSPQQRTLSTSAKAIYQNREPELSPFQDWGYDRNKFIDRIKLDEQDSMNGAAPSVGQGIGNGLKALVPPGVGLPSQPPQASAPSIPQSAPRTNGNGLDLGTAFKGFATGFMGPKAVSDMDAQYDQGQQEKAKRDLVWVQQTAQVPAEQRAKFTLDNAQDIARSTGRPLQSIIASAQDPSGFTDEAMNAAISKMSAMAGIAPDKPSFQAANLGNGGFGAFDPRTGKLTNVREPTPDAVKPTPKHYVQQEFNGKVWMVNQEDPTDKYELGKPNPSTAQGAAQDSYRPATPAELAAYGIPEGTAVKINTRTGEPHVVAGAKPASQYTTKQQNDFLSQARTLDALEGALNQYKGLVDKYGSITGDRNMNPLDPFALGGKREDAAELEAAHTNVLIQMKELFNLGVLNGPDLDIIERSIPPPTGWSSYGSTKETMKAKLGVAQDYITRGRNQIPQAFIEKARPNQHPGDQGNAARASASGWRPGAGMEGFAGQRQPAPAQAQPQQQQDIHPDIARAIDEAFGADQGGGPQEGDVEDGYRFKGGDPADPNNWEPE